MKVKVDFIYDLHHFKANIRDGITDISDDSGTCKTFFMQSLHKADQLSEKVDMIPARLVPNGERVSTELIDESDTEKSIREKLNGSNKLIMIDEADLVFNDNEWMVDVVNESSKENVIVIASRSYIKGLWTDYSTLAYMKQMETNVEIKYDKKIR